MNKLSVIIIVKNEEKNLPTCIESLKYLADEILIVDTGSTDKTLDICKKYNTSVIKSKWMGFGKTKAFAVLQSKNDWILSLDADEIITTDLKNKIKEILKKTEFFAYQIKRNSFYLGKEIKYSGWNKEYILRLFNRNYANFNNKPVHESVQTKSKVGKIKEKILHYTYPDLTSYILKTEHYGNLKALERKPSSVGSSIIHGFFKFIKMYFIDRGFLDGKIGLILSINSAFSVYLKHLKCWEKSKK